MAKRDPATGTFLKRPSDGKIIKPKGWKPSVVIIKGHRELLVFRNSSDWAQYRTASVHRGGDIVQAMKAVTPLIKLHIMLSAVHVTDEVKAKEYKTFGPLHHFTLSETSAEGKEKVILMVSQLSWSDS